MTVEPSSFLNPPSSIRVIPLGGLGEFGNNMMVYECGGDAVIVDCGMMFPESITLGVEVIIPDFTYVLENASKFRAVFLTHAHEDHYGAIPFLLRHLPRLPVYGLPLTIALMRQKLLEHELEEAADLRTMGRQEVVQAGVFRVEAIHVTHSTVDSVAFALETPLGIILHSGDFKLDDSPLDNRPTDVERLLHYAKRGVLLLFSDSTNILVGGSCPSERAVTAPLTDIIDSAPGRVIVTTFSSHLHRLQQVLTIGANCGRGVEVMGRSMLRNIEVGERLGYIRRPRPVPRPGHERGVVMLVTGSQAEPRSALGRAAVDENRRLTLGPGDTVVFSARVIPGFERPIARLMDNIHRRGADVISHDHPHVHSSGHAYRDELRELIELVKPKFFIPIHGTLRFIVHHGRLAEAAGVPRDRVFVITNGSVAELHADRCTIQESAVRHGKVFIDAEAGQIPDLVVRDRRHLGADGFVIVLVAIGNGKLVRQPEIVTRGVLQVDASKERLEQIRAGLEGMLLECKADDLMDETVLSEKIRAWTKRYFRKQMNRRPMIVPVIWEM
jgi:ribonuclease J